MADVIHHPAPRYLTEAFHAVTPTRWTVFLRTFIPYQIIRFAMINLKMLRIIQISHASHPRRGSPRP